jgi:hypothetical protein
MRQIGEILLTPKLVIKEKQQITTSFLVYTGSWNGIQIGERIWHGGTGSRLQASKSTYQILPSAAIVHQAFHSILDNKNQFLVVVSVKKVTKRNERHH